MAPVLDAVALLAILSMASFAVSGVLALPLLRDLAAQHGLPIPLTLIVLIPLVGLPIFFLLLLRAEARG
jgi:hypothetical protein